MAPLHTRLQAPARGEAVGPEAVEEGGEAEDYVEEVTLRSLKVGMAIDTMEPGLLFHFALAVCLFSAYPHAPDE